MTGTPMTRKLRLGKSWGWNLRPFVEVGAKVSYWYWQFKNGRVAGLRGNELCDRYIDMLNAGTAYKAWDRSLGAWVVYAA